MPSRFDYVRYDEVAQQTQERFKKLVMQIEEELERSLPLSRSKSLALTALEEFYMWVGKGIRDEQIQRNGYAAPQEERTNS